MNTQKVREEFNWLEETKRISRLFALAKVKWMQVKWEDDTGEHVEMLPTGSYAFWQMPARDVSSAKVFDIALADAAQQIAEVYPNPPSMKATGLTSAKTYSRTMQHLAVRGVVTPPQQGKGTQWLEKPETIEAPEKVLVVTWYQEGQVVKPSQAQTSCIKGIQASLPEGVCVTTVELEPNHMIVYVKRNGALNKFLPGFTEHLTEDFSYKEYPNI